MGDVDEKRPRQPDESRQHSVDFKGAQDHLFENVGMSPRSRFIDLEEPAVRVHVLEEGNQSDSTPLLFVHGTGAFGAFMAPLMAQFDDARTMAFDRPGFGLSGEFVYTKKNILKTHVDVLLGVLEALDITQVDLVGNSMGGHAGIRFALEHPTRVHRLVLVGSVPAFPGTRAPIPIRLLTVPLLSQLIQLLQKSGEEGVLDIMEIFGERETIQRYPSLIRAMAAHDSEPGRVRAELSEFSSFASWRGFHSSVMIRELDLRGLENPTLVIWGDNDPLGGPEEVREGVNTIPDIRFEPIDTGHVPFFAYPDRCARMIEEFRNV